jgi:predicted MFS family arabinose efflux permease
MATASPKDPARYVLAATAANGLAFIIPNTSPFVIGSLIEGFPMGPENAGLILTAELLAMGGAALGISPLMGVISRRSLAVLATVLVAVANASVVLRLVGGFAGLLAIRVVAGIGAGLLLATANAAIAGSASPSRLYGFTLMLGWLVAACLGPVMAFAVGQWSFVGAYAVWMMLAVLAAPLVSGIGERKPSGSTESQAPDQSLLLGVVHVSGIVLVGLAMMAYFAFVERLGQHLGFTLKEVGILFAGISIAGAAGAGLASTLQARFGLIAPLLLGTALHTTAIVVAVESQSRLMFAVGAVGEGFTFMYLLAYQLAVAATFDRDGRWAAAASGAMIGSTGIGPYVGGAIIGAYGFTALSALNIGATLMALVAFAWVGRNIVRR